MVKFDKVIRAKQLKVLSLIFKINDEVDNEYEAYKLVQQALMDAKEQHNLENFNISLFVKDDTKRKWKQGTSDPNLFIKLFFNELDYVKSEYGVTTTEMGFLYSLSRFLLWEENLLVDKDGLPLNQKSLIKELEITRKTVYKYTKSLESKKCLIRLYDGRDVYYIINPNLMFFGERINKGLPKLFELIDYIPMCKAKLI